MTKKVGIITINDNANYGNRLQNYAVQKVLTDLGYSPVTIKNVPYCEYRYELSRRNIINSVKRVLLYSNPFFYKYRAAQERLVQRQWEDLFNKNIKKYENFSRFNENIAFYEKCLTQYCYSIDTSDFFAFVTGSDQVWNYRYHHANHLTFLGFAHKTKRIAVSASMGITVIPQRLKRRYRKYLSHFSAISVREKSAENAIHQLGVKCNNITTLVDPTMMVGKEIWQKLAQKSAYKEKNRYIVKCFLGSEDQVVNTAINAYCTQNNCKVIDISKEGNSYGPYEFLWLISNAQFVFTDSFHACVFSILFERNFYAFRRKGDDETIFNRIEGLLNLFYLSNRIYEHGNLENIHDDEFKISQEILENERKRYTKFLISALEGNGDR